MKRPELSPEAWELYREALQNQATASEEPALDELSRLGLVVADPMRPGMYIPAEPGRVANALRGIATETLSAVAEYLTHLPRFMDAVTDEFRRAEQAGTATLEHVTDYDEVNGRLARATDAAVHEVLTSQPGRRNREQLLQVEERDEDLLGRGVKLRTTYHESTRHDDWSLRWVRFVTERGAQVRTLPGPFVKMIVFDYREAFVGVYEGGELGPGALHVRNDQIVWFMRQVFELNWAAATPWVPRAAASSNPAEGSVEGAGIVTTPQQRSILWGLAQGKTQEQVAKDHGMSTRTLTNRLEPLKDATVLRTVPALLYWYATSQDRHIQD
ncbi:TrmB family transcriptional regulator [Actinacidiphila glaucinigra]|uniref:TrmB family transcriptional regulator n=1 Tax=Actinacidiphila glaucinigra TaxID=235986 RepID=UPI003D94E4AE